jgi:hypothetical protein
MRGRHSFIRRKPMSFKKRIITAFPVLSKMLSRPKPFLRQVIVTGAAAGDVTVTDIKKNDELVSVFNLSDITDVTSEFKVLTNGKINNTGGTSTATKKVLVTWLAWTE